MILTKSKAIEKVRDCLKKGIFKTIRLLKIEGEDRTTIFPWNKVNVQEALNRLNWIEYKIENELGAGVYELQCKMNFTKHGLEEKYRFEIKEKKTISLSPSTSSKIEEPQTEQVNNMNQDIDFEDYVKLIKENAELKAQMNVLEMERDFYKKISNERPTALNDNTEKPLLERAIEGLAEQAPTLLALANEFFEQRGRKIAIEEKKLNLKNQNPIKRMRKIKSNESNLEGNETREQIAERLSLLSEVDNDQFNEELDLIEQQDPQLYEFLCDALEIEDCEEE